VQGHLVLEKNLPFLRQARYGYLTACPSNLGTSMRITVTARLPLIFRDEERLRNLSRDLNLDIQRMEGDDGVLLIHNKQVMGFTEYEIVKSMQDGLMALINNEEEIEAGGDAQPAGDDA